MKIFYLLAIGTILMSGLAGCRADSTNGQSIELIGSGIFTSESGQSIQASYRADDTVVLSFPDGSTRLLTRARAASGTRYVSNTAEWWEHQGEAKLSIDGEQVFSGRLQ
ncbi:MAG: MliC family protein [Gammaproteobacteria bacterium]|nr:MliC family protein [Pseudomonadales bacterium]MCP5347514.1 MliC family protein [Pseudomonadales bacterium]